VTKLKNVKNVFLHVNYGLPVAWFTCGGIIWVVVAAAASTEVDAGQEQHGADGSQHGRSHDEVHRRSVAVRAAPCTTHHEQAATVMPPTARIAAA